MNAMKLDRNAILNASVGEIVTVPVPEWGGDVCLRPLSGAEVSVIYGKDMPSEQVTQALVVASICDESGARLFTNEDAPALFAKSYSSLQPIITKALEINRMTKESADAAKKA
jgi:hypothetical protein